MRRILIAALLLLGTVASYAAYRSVIDDSYDVIGTGALPTCDSSKRGKQWFVEGGAGVADVLQVCVKGVLDTYAWSNLQ